jgi:hypothetical protein
MELERGIGPWAGFLFFSCQLRPRQRIIQAKSARLKPFRELFPVPNRRRYQPLETAFRQAPGAVPSVLLSPVLIWSAVDSNDKEDERVTGSSPAAPATIFWPFLRFLLVLLTIS